MTPSGRIEQRVITVSAGSASDQRRRVSARATALSLAAAVGLRGIGNVLWQQAQCIDRQRDPERLSLGEGRGGVRVVGGAQA